MSIMNSLDWQQPANDNSSACMQCGIEINGPKTKLYCGKACSSKAKRIRDRAAGKARNDGAPDRICEECGAVFQRRKDSHNAARFCSRSCGFVAQSNLRAEQRVSPHLRSASLGLTVSHKVARCICKQCAQRFDGRHLGDIYCSDECSENHKRTRYIANNDNGRDRAPRPCAGCGNIFEPEYGDRRRKFCSPSCVKMTDDHKARRKAAKLKRRGAVVENVNPIEVFERDGWRCQLCGVRTPRKLRGTYSDRAPELDHILPISKGGEHSYVNTQCACRKCNGLKGDVPLGQMRLVG